MKRPRVSAWEKAAASVYGAVFDYGNSIARPFLALFTGLVFFALIYAGLGLASGPAGAPGRADRHEEILWQGWEFSWNNTFRPLSALSTEAPREGNARRLAGQLMYERSGAVAALVRAVATLQWLLGLVTAFLFALAVRRRLQIDAADRAMPD